MQEQLSQIVHGFETARVHLHRLAAKTSTEKFSNGYETREKLLADFETLQNQQIALTKDAEGRALEKIHITSPFNARMKYNAYSCLVLLPPHQIRHIEQGENVWS